jgi:hypothetical protein
MTLSKNILTAKIAKIFRKGRKGPKDLDSSLRALRSYAPELQKRWT